MKSTGYEKYHAAREKNVPRVDVHVLHPQLPDDVPQWSQPTGDVFRLIRKGFDKSRHILFPQQADDKRFL